MIRNAHQPLAAASSRALTRALSTTPAGLAVPSSSQTRLPARSQKPQKHAPSDGNPQTGRIQRLEAQHRPRYVLEPHVLATRLSKLAEEDKLDEAIETLKNMPRDSQNTVVWNAMISYAGRQGRAQLAYSLYIDVRPPPVVFS